MDRSARRTMSLLKKSIYLLTLFFLLPLSANANGNDSSLLSRISGTVVDQTGAKVAGASVVLLGTASTESQRSVTDQKGHFEMERVLGADYVIAVHKNGFREVRRVLHVNGGETVELHFQLNVAPIVETVTVTPTRGQPQDVS